MITQQNSQDEEGFIATKMIPKLSEVDDIRDSKGKEYKMFSPFYLPSGQVSLKQQLPQSLEDIDQFEIEEQKQTENKVDDKTFRRKFMKRNFTNYLSQQHPFRIYAQTSMFQLVNSHQQWKTYSKNSSEQPLQNQFQYIKNQIMLQTAQIKSKDQPKSSQTKKKSQTVNLLRNPYSRLVKPFDNQINPIQRNLSSKSMNSRSNADPLVFDSRFQCGNLHCVYQKHGSNEYHLFLQNDTNSYGYNHWFYFSITNIRPQTQYTFIIVNLKKKFSFFKQGFKPILFSQRKYEENGNKNGWYRSGFNINYQDSHITTSRFFKFYKLNFSLKFKHQDDHVLVAANMPYSFSRLSNYIQKFTKKFRLSSDALDLEVASLKVSSLGRTFCGNNVPEIKIAPKDEDGKYKSFNKGKKKEKGSSKKMIVILARQHPGETVSSYLLQSILQQISTFGFEAKNQTEKQQKDKVKYLLKNYTIVIYPMINIDGVIYGNSRCDVSGMDLNRRWKNPSKIFHPQIFNIKNKLECYSRKYEIACCIDLHGHSKLYNVFCYSCKINPITCRILPYLISKETDKFYFPSCTFGIAGYKSTTARAAIFKIIKNENVLTIESSYFGYLQNNQTLQKKDAEQNLNEKIIIRNEEQKSGQKKLGKYFQPKDFKQIAVSILIGLQLFLNKEETKKYKQVENEIKENLTEILGYEKENKDEQDGAVSESDPEGDEIDFQTKINSILGKEFVEQASCFMPAEEENIDINELMQLSVISQCPSENARVRTQEREQVQTPIKDSQEKVEQVNKIRITKIKVESNNKKAVSNQKLKGQLNFISLTPKPKPQPKRELISRSFHQKARNPTIVSRQKKINSTPLQKTSDKSERFYRQNNQHVTFVSNKNHSQIKTNDDVGDETKKQPNIQKFNDDLTVLNSDNKEMFNNERSNLLEHPSNQCGQQPPENEFFIKFKKFIPSHQMSSYSRKQKLTFLQESIYKDDQRQILNTLMQNKKRLEKQKMRRELDKPVMIGDKFNPNRTKSNSLWSEQLEVEQRLLRGFVGGDGRKREDIVDFRKFKDRDKIKLQLRQTNYVNTKFIKKEPFC